MGVSQSFLSSPEYGYDYVLAVTQDSINATALAFLDSRQPVVQVCYIHDGQAHPKPIDYETLKKNARGADPFKIPASGPQRDTDLANLYAAGFVFGFQAAMGLPEKFHVDQLPPIVTLGDTAAHPVAYRLLCRNFLVVELQKENDKLSFNAFAQPKGPEGQPWIYTYQVKLVNQPVTDNQAFSKSPAFANLPAAVQKKVIENPEDFTIQHLLFDFNRAATAGPQPTISGVSPELKKLLDKDFAIKYFAEMEATGSPVIAITPANNDPFAKLKTEFSIKPYPGEPKLSTVSYLCATAEHPLPPAKPFTWNWIDKQEEGEDFDGVCVINRNDLAANLKAQLQPYVNQNCWLPQPLVIISTISEELVGFDVVDRNYDWPGGYPEPLKQTYAFQAPSQGSVLLNWRFRATRENDDYYYHWGGGDSYIRSDTYFDMKVYNSAKTLTIEQHVIVYYHLVMNAEIESTSLVDVLLTDTCTLAVVDNRITASVSSHKVDKSQQPAYWPSMPALQGQMLNSREHIVNAATSHLVDIPLSVFNSVIFPGGKAFFFKDVGFSEHQDLVAHITYQDPT